MSSLSLIRHQFFEHNCKNNSISREKRKHNYNILQAFLKRVMLRKSGIIYPTLSIILRIKERRAYRDGIKRKGDKIGMVSVVSS